MKLFFLKLWFWSSLLQETEFNTTTYKPGLSGNYYKTDMFYLLSQQILTCDSLKLPPSMLVGTAAEMKKWQEEKELNDSAHKFNLVNLKKVWRRIIELLKRNFDMLSDFFKRTTILILADDL